MKDLYCIHHERMVEPFTSPYAPLSHSFWVDTGDPETEDLVICDFDGGWATCPPPDFDLDEYIEQNGQPPAIIESDFSPYTYDVELDKILVEVL